MKKKITPLDFLLIFRIKLKTTSWKQQADST